jgi:DNA-directed RNA polymerase subunit RPC12/RpoP
MRRADLESQVRLAIYTCNVSLEHCNKVTKILMDLIDQYVDPPTGIYVCAECKSYEEVDADELRAVGPPSCPDCGQRMTLLKTGDPQNG